MGNKTKDEKTQPGAPTGASLDELNAEELLAAAKALESRLTEAREANAAAGAEIAALRETVSALQANSGPDAEELGEGSTTTVGIYMRKLWRRAIPGVTEEALAAGPVCVAKVILREGMDANLLADGIRGGFCGEGEPRVDERRRRRAERKAKQQ